jgi:hypothetical protein
LFRKHAVRAGSGAWARQCMRAPKFCMRWGATDCWVLGCLHVRGSACTSWACGLAQVAGAATRCIQRGRSCYWCSLLAHSLTLTQPARSNNNNSPTTPQTTTGQRNGAPAGISDSSALRHSLSSHPPQSHRRPAAQPRRQLERLLRVRFVEPRRLMGRTHREAFAAQWRTSRTSNTVRKSSAHIGAEQEIG